MESYKKPTIIKLNIKKISIVGIWLTFILSVVFIVLNRIIHQHTEITLTLWNVLLFIIGYIILIILHEAFHLLGFILFGKAKFHDLDYGLNMELGVAYATTKKPLLNRGMKKALLLPFWTTGVIPTIVGFIINSNLLVLLGAWLIAGAVGDFYMYKELRKFPNNALVKDDPQLPKLYVYKKEDQ